MPFTASLRRVVDIFPDAKSSMQCPSVPRQYSFCDKSIAELSTSTKNTRSTRRSNTSKSEYEAPPRSCGLVSALHGTSSNAFSMSSSIIGGATVGGGAGGDRTAVTGFDFTGMYQLRDAAPAILGHVVAAAPECSDLDLVCREFLTQLADHHIHDLLVRRLQIVRPRVAHHALVLDNPVQRLPVNFVALE